MRLLSLLGTAGGAYVFGHLTHHDHLSETGLLSAEAALNSTLITSRLRETARRERPYQGSGDGTFFEGGKFVSFGAFSLAWSIASIFAHEYPGPLTQIAAYGLAS